jgi:hypothetical protein
MFEFGVKTTNSAFAIFEQKQGKFMQIWPKMTEFGNLPPPTR